MRKKILSILLAGTMLFSQCMAVPAADLPDAGIGITAAAEEEEDQSPDEAEEAAEDAAVAAEDAAQPSEEAPAAEPAIEEDEPAEEEAAAPEEAAGDESAQVEEETDVADEEAAEESPAPVTEEAEEPAVEETEDPAAEEALPAAEPVDEEPAAEEETTDPALAVLSDYTFELDRDNSGDVYQDSTGEYIWSAPIIPGDDDTTGWVYHAEVVEYEGDNNDDFSQAVYIVDDILYVDGAVLASMNVTYIAVELTLSVNGTPIDTYSMTIYLPVYPTKVDYEWNVHDNTILPGSNLYIDRFSSCTVQNGQYPFGEDYMVEITDVSVDNDGVLSMAWSDEDSYSLEAVGIGDANVTVTYTDWDGTEGCTREFLVSVRGDIYRLNISSEGDIYQTLLGSSISLYANAIHEIYDPETGSHETLTGDEVTGVSYQWSYEILDNQDGGRDPYVSLVPDPDNAGCAELIFRKPDNYPTLDVIVTLSLFANGEKQAETTGQYSAHDDYYELWPVEFNEEVPLGGEITFVPELRHYSIDAGGYEVVPYGGYEIELTNDSEDTCEIVDNNDGTYTIRRFDVDQVSFIVDAQVNDENGNFICSLRRYYWLQDEHSFDVGIDWRNGNTVFTDGVSSFPLLVEGFDGLDYDLFARAWDGDNPNVIIADSVVWVDSEEKLLYIDGTSLQNLNGIDVMVGVEVGGRELGTACDAFFSVRDPRIDYHFGIDNDDLLPGWDYDVDKQIGCHVENSTYPNGQDMDLTATAIEIADESVVHITGSDDGAWHLKANDNKLGKTDVTLTFTDWDGTEQTRTFTLSVGTDVYHIDYWFESPSHRTLPGGTVTMMAQARRESYDPATGDYHDYSDEELGSISYDWDFYITNDDARNYLQDIIVCSQDENDPRRASVYFPNMPYAWDWIDVEATVTISENGHELASEARNVSMATYYMELYPRALENPDLAVGEEIILRPEVRLYSADEENYTVVPHDHLRFQAEIYNDQAYEITEIEENGQKAFKVKRLNGDNTSFRIRAYRVMSDDHEEEFDDVEYWLNGQDFDFWYDIEGADEIFNDGTRTFGFCLDGLDGLDFQLVPQVGLGEWDPENGFDTPLPEGTYWTFDGNANTITFDGAALYAAGIDHVNTRIALLIGGVEVEDERHGFDVWESEYWYPGEFEDQVLLVGDYRYIPSFGSLNVRNNDHPDGENVPFTVTDLQVSSSDHPFDARDTVSTRVDDGGMEVKAVRGGEAYFTATIHADDMDLTREFTYHVDDQRYTLNLQTSTHSDRMPYPGTLTITPQIFAEAIDPETGWHYDMGTEGLTVRYELSCNDINWDAVNNLHMDPVTAMDRGMFWDYTLDEASNSVTITTDNNVGDVGFLEIEVRAFLIDTETGETLTETVRNISSGIFFHHLTFFDEQGEEVDWNEDLLPGEMFTVTPQLMVSNPGGDDPVENFNTSNTRYQIGFYPGSGNEWDPPHLRVWDKDGNEILSDQEVTPDAFPLTIQRQVEWSFGLSVRAVWYENDGGFDNDLYSDFYCNDFSTEAGFTAHEAAGSDEYEATYYYYQPIHVTLDRSELEELQRSNPDLVFTTGIGIYDYDKKEITPVLDSNGASLFTGYFDAAECELIIPQDKVEAIQEALAYQLDPNGRVRPYLNLYFMADINGVTIYETIYTVNIVSDTVQLDNYVHEMGVGQTHVVPAENSLYVNKLGFDGNYDITITDIHFVNDNDSQYLSISKNADGDWLLTALRFSDLKYIPLEAEFTDNSITNGAPARLYVIISESLITYGLDYDSHMNGIKEIVIGGSYTFTPDVKRHIFNEGDEEIVQDVLPRGSVTGGYSYDIEFYDYNPDILAVDSATGTITGRDEGSSNLTVDICVYDEHDALCDRYSFDLTVYVRTFIEELTVKENPSFELVTGISYTAKALADTVTPTFTIYSMKHPEGEVYPVQNFYLCDFVAGDATPTLTGGNDGEYTAVKVANGQVSSITYGSAILRARTAEGFQSEVLVPVTVKPATIALSAKTAKIVKTKYKKITVTMTPGDSISKVITSKSSVATATFSGRTVKITAGKTAGTAKIKITLKSGKVAYVTVTVPKYNCTGITAKTSYTVTTKSTIDLGVKLKPVYSDNKITYKSANTKIATVTSKGIVKGVKVGKTKVTIKTDNGKTKTVTIVVKQGTTALKTDKTAYTVKKGKTVTIKATKTPSTSADPITFTSSNTKVATVTAKGVVKGVKKGKVTITVKSGTITKKVTVTVK